MHNVKLNSDCRSKVTPPKLLFLTTISTGASWDYRQRSATGPRSQRVDGKERAEHPDDFRRA